MLKNYMEVIVDYILISLLGDPEYKDLCECEQCISDIKAIALNNLQPKYIGSNDGLIYPKIHELRMQGEVDATTALIRAINIVKDSPRHE